MRALHKKYRKRTQCGISHRVARIFSSSPIGEGFESAAQLFNYLTKGQGIFSKGGTHILVSWGIGLPF